jgi:hypothetical protein
VVEQTRFPIRALRSEISAERAFGRLQRLFATDRGSSFAGYARSADYAEEAMRSAGLERVERIPVPADGVTRFEDWVMPLAWDVEEAFLEVLGENGRPGGRLCSWREEPNSLAMWSAPTPREGLEAELVAEEDAADWRGRLVLTGRRPNRMKREAVQRGAVGVVSDFHPAPEEYPESTFWSNAWGDGPGSWMMTARDSRLPGFLLSPRAGRRLREMLSSRPGLRLGALVRSRLYEGKLPVVTGVLPGADPRAGEVLLSAHIYEQGAHDNCSGGAVVLEVARALSALVGRGELPRPRRSLRFMLQAECYGTMAYARLRPEAAARTAAALTLDGVGKAAPLVSYRLPLCRGSFVEQLARESLIAALGPDGAWAERPFNMGDNLLNDPAIGVPCAWFNTAGPPRHWHTSADDLAALHVPALGQAGLAAAAWLLFAAGPGLESARWLVGRIAGAQEESLRASRGTAAPGRLEVELRRGWAALESCLELVDGTEQRALAGEVRAAARRLGGVARGLDGARDAGPGTGSAAGNGDRAVPARLMAGPLTFGALAAEESAALGGNPGWWGPRTAAWWWCDGRRTIGEISRLVRYEFAGEDLEVGEYLRSLAAHGYLTLDGVGGQRG